MIINIGTDNSYMSHDNKSLHANNFEVIFNNYMVKALSKIIGLDKQHAYMASLYS